MVVFKTIFPFLAGALIVFSAAQLDAAGGGEDESTFPAVIPMGMESLLPRPHGHVFAIYASAEGLQPPGQHTGNAPAGSDASGYFPSPLSFRVTATTIGISADTTRPAEFESSMQTARLMSSLRFRLRVYRGGLHTDRFQPVDTRLIGVPADVPYGERIYRVTFETPPLPMTDRLILEVMSPDGELLCKFPLVVN